MSLPTAPKDISEHPTAGSVVDPIDKVQKEKDVDRKIRLYGVIEAFRQGKLPSNAQIDSTLQYVLNNSPIGVDSLSPDGKKLVSDTRDIIETARMMVLEKNADELFQNFVWGTQDWSAEDLKTGDLSKAVPVEGDKAREDGKQAVQHLRTLLTLILTNSEVRKLLTDFSLIGRDLLSRTLQKTAGAIAPTDEQLANVDQSAPNDQFVTAGGRIAGPNETPVLEARVPGTDHVVQRHPREEEGKLVNPDGTTRGLGDVKNEARGRAGEVMDQAPGAAQDAQNRVASEVDDVDGPEDVEAKKRGFIGKMKDMRDNISNRIPQEHKDKANDHVERTKRFLSEEYFPEERRDQFIFRGKKVILESQKHADYQSSITWLLSFIEEYAAHARSAAEHPNAPHNELISDPKLRTTLSELRTLLERFANGMSMDVMLDAINALVDDTRRDPELRRWFEEVDAYIRKVLLEPGYVLEPDCNNQANRLRESGRGFFDDKYRGHFDNLFSSVGTWFKAMGEDPLNDRFGQDWARLTKDLLFDDNGSLTFKPELWNDIRKVILPELIAKIGYIPIPRIEYTDDSLDLVVENLTLQGRNLFPNIVSIEAQNFVKFSPYDAIKDDHHHRITLTLEQMQADMRDVAFYFRKKGGAIKLTDSGLADVVLGGEGLSATVHLVSATHDPTSIFHVKDVQVKVDSLKFSIRDSKHDFLYKTLKPLVTGLVKKQIQKSIRDALTTGLEYVDGQLVGVRDRMQAAKVNEGESRTQVLQNLFARKAEEASIRSSQSSSQFKIVSDKRQSLLSTAGHPAGWVNRTSEKIEAAHNGNEWRSDAFTIVPETTGEGYTHSSIKSGTKSHPVANDQAARHRNANTSANTTANNTYNTTTGHKTTAPTHTTPASQLNATAFGTSGPTSSGSAPITAGSGPTGNLGNTHVGGGVGGVL